MNKLLFISNSLADVEKVKYFAKKNHFSFEHYSKEEWKNLSAKGVKWAKEVKWTKGTKKNQKKPSNTINHSLSIIKMPVTGSSIQTMDEIKFEGIKTALLQSRGNASKAAKSLKISRATLYRKLYELGMNLESMRKNIAETDYPTPLKKSA